MCAQIIEVTGNAITKSRKRRIVSVNYSMTRQSNMLANHQSNILKDVAFKYYQMSHRMRKTGTFWYLHQQAD